VASYHTSIQRLTAQDRISICFAQEAH